MSLLDSILNAFGNRKSTRRGTPRRAARLMVSHPVRLRPATTTGDQPGLLEDLSSGGACVRSAVHLRTGDSVILNVNLSSALRFEQAAKVVYALRQQSGYHTRYGLRFIELRSDIKLAIAKYVAEEQHGRAYGVQSFSQPVGPA